MALLKFNILYSWIKLGSLKIKCESRGGRSMRLFFRIIWYELIIVGIGQSNIKNKVLYSEVYSYKYKSIG